MDYPALLYRFYSVPLLPHLSYITGFWELFLVWVVSFGDLRKLREAADIIELRGFKASCLASCVGDACGEASLTARTSGLELASGSGWA